MKEIEFKAWLTSNNYSKKVQSDVTSRIKKIERIDYFTDIDSEYHSDYGVTLLSIFKNKGENEAMNKLDCSSLPVGKYQLSTYKYAIKLYFKFLESLQ
ncbi:MAG: hypothetical protein R3Y54_12800 [Eubacteriales bacterium]